MRIPDPASATKFHRCFQFRVFTIKYDTQFEDLELSEGVLIDKNTHEEVLLIKGPRCFDSAYTSYSIELYEKMADQKRKTEPHSPLEKP